MWKCLFLIFVCYSSNGYSQVKDYWQQENNYNLRVVLNDRNHTLKGEVDIEYINHSPDTLNFIWFHLWPNAYKNESTAFASQIRASGRKKIRNADRGFMDSISFTVDEEPVVSVPDSNNIDITKLQLTHPLFPGDTIRIKTPFFVKLPAYSSRSGHFVQQYMICQWYPKPAVYDRKGWHPMPYLDQGEFYSEFGNYKVSITLPSAYVVGASGKLLTEPELKEYKKTGLANYKSPDKPARYFTIDPALNKTLEFEGKNIHDFAWFADKDFIIQYDTLGLNSGATVDVFSYYHPGGNGEWKNSIEFLKDATRFYSDLIGEYPYPVVAAVEGPKNVSSGGMEYPMITLITSPDANRQGLDAVITHEIGHNWFYGILASNERDHPWMDEGINSFFQFRYEATKYRSNSIFGNNVPPDMKSLSVDDFMSRLMLALNSIPANAAIDTKSTGFSNKDEYGIVVYLKAAIWMFVLERTLGTEDLSRGMKQYFKDWKFRHPYPEDFRESLEKATGKNLSEVFELLDKEGNLK